MTNETNVMTKTVNGFVWKFMEKIGSQAMQLIIQIILARILLPEEYGLVGLLTIFITISDVFILQGLTTALIQKKEADEMDFSSVFFSNIVISLILYLGLYFLSPWVAAFYNEPTLNDLMRVLSLNVIIGAFPAVHNAIMTRELDFKKSFIRNISNVLTQGFVGIPLAYFGFGAWAMVFSKLSGTCVGAIVLCITVKWSPKKIFSIFRVGELFKFSSKVLVTNLLNTIFNNIHSIVIGKYYSAMDVGYYQRGQQIPQAAMSSLDGAMTEVLYPSFSKIQTDAKLLKEAVRKSIAISMYMTLPVLWGLFAIAEPLTILLLTDKWVPSVSYMKLSCIVCMFWPLSHRTHALNAIGRSDVTLKLSLIGKSVTVFFIVLCIDFGIYALMLGTIVASVVNVFIASYYVKKYLGYTGRELLLDVFPSFVVALGMGLIVEGINVSETNLLLNVIVQIIAGMFIYFFVSYVFKLKGFVLIMNILKRRIRNIQE